MRTFLLRSCLVALVLAASVPTRAGPMRAEIFGVDSIEAYRSIEKAGASKDVAHAADLLEAGIETTWAHIAIACGDALAAIGPKAAEDPEYQKVLAKAMRLKEPRILTNLARVLGAYADPSVDEPLSYLCSGRRPPEMLAEALFMAGNLRPTAKTPYLKTVMAVAAGLKSKHPDVQVAACSAAGRIKDPSFPDLLAAIVRRSQEKYPGLYAVAALSKMGAKGELGSFIHVLEGDIKLETAHACLKAVTDLATPADAKDLLALMNATKKDYREAACIAVGLMAARGEMFAPRSPGAGTVETKDFNNKILTRLFQIIGDGGEAWEVRDAADRTIQRIGEGARAMVDERVPNLVGTFDRDISLTGMELAGRFAVKDTYRDLVKTAVFEKDRVLRMFAARALSTVGPDEAIAEWREAAQKDHKGRTETLNAIRAMGYIRTERAYQTLVEFFEGSPKTWSEEILKEVERSLERLTGHRFGRWPQRWSTWYARAKAHDPFNPHIAKFDRTKNRREAVEKRLYGLTETTERSVENGLGWLERQQEVLGSWDGNGKARAPGEAVASGPAFGGVIGCEPAYTGLSLLALLGAGYTSSGGKFHESVRRASEFLSTTQYYDGGYPVTGGGDDSWIFAYLIGMGIWGVTESYAMSGDDGLRWPAQRGCDYLVRVQTPGGGWRYGARYVQSDTSCTSWVLMTLKSASLLGLDVSPKAMDGIDSWLERCASDITGEEEIPEDMMSGYDKEVGQKRLFKAFTGYFELSGSEASSLQMTSMTAVGMVCRFFMGWNRSHPFMIGSANFLMDYLPQWRKGLEKGMAIAWYFYFYYYGTLAMHQMGGRYWRAWNEKIKSVLPSHQRKEPPELAGSWDPDTAVLNGGRLFSTAMGCLTLETYYRFSPLMLETEEDLAKREAERKAAEAKARAAKEEAERKAREAGGTGEAPAPAMTDDGAGMGGSEPGMGG